MKIQTEIEIDSTKAFYLLLETLNAQIEEDNVPNFVVEDGEIVAKDYDDRGELYLALYHLATKIFPNTEFRNVFSDPNTLMSKLYLEKER